MQYTANRSRESRLEMRDLQPSASRCNARPITRSWSRKAVRVRSSALFFACKTRKNEKPRCSCWGALSAVDYSKALSPGLASYKRLQCTASGVGQSSSIDRLTDVPEFRRVRHRRKASPECREKRVVGILHGPDPMPSGVLVYSTGRLRGQVYIEPDDTLRRGEDPP